MYVCMYVLFLNDCLSYCGHSLVSWGNCAAGSHWTCNSNSSSSSYANTNSSVAQTDLRSRRQQYISIERNARLSKISIKTTINTISSFQLPRYRFKTINRHSWNTYHMNWYPLYFRRGMLKLIANQLTTTTTTTKTTSWNTMSRQTSCQGERLDGE